MGASAPATADEPLRPDEWVTVIEGNVPLVLCAAHGARRNRRLPGVDPRSDRSVPGFSDRADLGTAELTLDLLRTLEQTAGWRPFAVVARFHRSSIDANRPAAHAYEDPRAGPVYDRYHAAVRNAVSTIRDRWGGGLLLDIHGQARRPEVIWRGTRDGESLTDLHRRAGHGVLYGDDGLFTRLHHRGYAVFPPAVGGEEAPLAGGHTVRTYGSHRTDGIDAIQLEIGSAYRLEPAPRERLVEDLAAVLAAVRDDLFPGPKMDENAATPGASERDPDPGESCCQGG